MITKEQCENKLKNLKTLQDEVNKNGLVNATANIAFSNAIECFEYLIKEHFDNPPLKFEELQKEMWIWDDKEKMWIHSVNNCDNEVYGKGIIVEFEFDLVRYPFEPNRFYRKEVQNV